MRKTHVVFVDCLPGVELGAQMSLARFGEVQLDRSRPDDFERYLHELEPGSELAAAFVGSSSTSVPAAVKKLRGHARFTKTRLFVVGDAAGGPVPGWVEALDVEDILAPSAFDGFGLADTVGIAMRAYSSLTLDPLYTDFYLDMTWNKIFDWFETTRWDWKELDLDRLNPELMSEEETDFLTEAAIIEFGTLPGAHNFLREWEGETSFSSWALAWGAEEARHSLVQARCLDKLGIKVRSKHALYKREPYPIGNSRTGTLVMNIISEARAAELYRSLAAETKEPVVRGIWKLLGRDESRHARAFYVFAQELCDANREERIAALKMAYVWLADRSDGLKHPAGHFYPHSTSAKGIRRIETIQDGATDAADNKVLQMVRRLVEDDSIESSRDIKRKLRSLIR
ncbi:ferritin-like domain-containing protein [Streptomyces niveiscabiei]|uniref:ferritin-like domain-containing protein n=1 Tax=Streptomyces niveiscabiei TaxID=164115 RepID=UPI0029BB6C46|nr:ferritin-like domain-containing protein [Streptomyces niveiscabiei]MDX3384060.1 ferritin-like domain-containing protein [Streptomyces niveiscabiei]